MQARGLIEENTSFGPDTIKAMGQALDEAWAEIAGNFGGDSAVIEGTRMKLANAILAAAGNGTKGVAALKRAAMENMRQNYLV